MVHLRRITAIRYNTNPYLLELREVVLQEYLDQLQVSWILNKPSNLPPFEIMMQTIRNDIKVILLPVSEYRVLMAELLYIDVYLEVL